MGAVIRPGFHRDSGGIDRLAGSDHLERQTCGDDLRPNEARCHVGLPGNVRAHMSAED